MSNKKDINDLRGKKTCLNKDKAIVLFYIYLYINLPSPVRPLYSRKSRRPSAPGGGLGSFGLVGSAYHVVRRPSSDFLSPNYVLGCTIIPRKLAGGSPR